MTTNTTKPTLISTKNAKIKQKKSVVSRLRKQNALRLKFAHLLAEAGLLHAFGLLLANAKPSDLRRSWSFGNGCIVHFSDDEYSSMQGLGVSFDDGEEEDADSIGEIGTIDLPAPGEIDRMLAELDHLPD